HFHADHPVFSCSKSEQKQLNTWVSFQSAEEPLLGQFSVSGNRRITLALTEYGFVVEDTGIGIPEEKQRAMFEPFVRGDEKRGEGLGLGLSLVQRICTNQKWEVQLYSQEPNGCRFSVNLMDNNKAQ
ncbi:sensor histidine kinase, partial [Pseudomonas viridiflava]